MNEHFKIVENIQGLVIFKTGDHEFCIDIRDVNEIMRMKDPEEMTGKVTELLEEFKLIDSHILLNEPADTTEQMIILSTFFTKKAAFIVDNVVEFISLDRLFFEKSVNLEKCEDRAYVRWVLYYQGRKIYYPDYELISKELYQIESIGLLKV